jgi:glycerol kinase
VYFVPAFVGLGAPYWDPTAKALICGMTYNTDKRHIVRAALESIAFQIDDVLEALEQGDAVDVSDIKVDGKPTENSFLMKFQAGISGKTIVKNCVVEASAYGSALLAGLATGFWKREDIQGLIRHGEVVRPEMPPEERAALHAGWRNAVSLSISKHY